MCGQGYVVTFCQLQTNSKYQLRTFYNGMDSNNKVRSNFNIIYLSLSDMTFSRGV